MKKYVIYAVAALAAVAFVSCNKDKEVDGDDTTVDVPIAPATDATNVCINEFNGTQKYIELYNPTAAEVNLNGWKIVKNNEEPVFWEGTANDKIPANGFLVVLSNKASGDVTTLDINKAENAGNGGLSGKKAIKLDLKNAAGTVVDYFDRGFTKAGNTEPALADLGAMSAGREKDGKAAWKVLDPATPGSTNNNATAAGDVSVDPE